MQFINIRRMENANRETDVQRLARRQTLFDDVPRPSYRTHGVLGTQQLQYLYGMHGVEPGSYMGTSQLDALRAQHSRDDIALSTTFFARLMNDIASIRAGSFGEFLNQLHRVASREERPVVIGTIFILVGLSGLAFRSSREA